LLERGRAAVARCDVAGIGADAVTVDALARLQLAARRHGCQVRLRNASEELRELLAFMGLQDVLPE
jgi:ABC-type transporter Mla MlaB component